MDHPSGEEDGENRYRSQAGTTICVRLNLYQLGGFRTLKELVDRYVQFPEVRVEYFGQEGHVVYPTQEELMAEVHALNPGGAGQPPKEHCWYISDEEFAELKRAHPEIVWENDERPGIAVKYCPLDWMAPGDQVSGVAVVAEVIKPNCHISNRWLDKESTVHFVLSYERYERRLRLAVGITLSQKIEENMKTIKRTLAKESRMCQLLDDYPIYQKDPGRYQYVLDTHRIDETEVSQHYHEAKGEQKEYRKLREKLGVYERAQRHFEVYISYTKLSRDYRLLNCLPDSLQKSGQESIESGTIVAFNGILADQSKFLGRADGFVGMILLLQQRYRPEVNLTRDTISELSLEAMAVLSILQRKLRLNYENRNIPEAFQISRFYLRTVEELWALLEEQPALKDELRFGSHPLYEAAELLRQGKVVELLIDKCSLYDMLYITAVNKLGAVLRYEDSLNCNIKLCTGTKINSTSSFPISLFFAWEASNPSFAIVRKYWPSPNLYNSENPFSQWLIGHQQELRKKVPGIYNTLLEDMIMDNDSKALCKKLNDGLSRLQSIPGNPYEVNDSLFLKESDFVQTV